MVVNNALELLKITYKSTSSSVCKRYDNDHAGAVPEDLLSCFISSQEMHEQIRLSCQRDALHQTINTEFERANGFYPC